MYEWQDKMLLQKRRPGLHMHGMAGNSMVLGVVGTVTVAALASFRLVGEKLPPGCFEIPASSAEAVFYRLLTVSVC